MKITVFGSGYVGLVTGACLADVGHEVLCVDVDARKVEMLRRAEVPIYEPGLSELVKGCLAQKTLAFTTSAKEGVEHGELIFIAVGTPPDEDGSSDLKYVFAVAKSIAEHMNGPKVVIDKSTVPVGTAEKVAGVIADGLEQRGANIRFHVCSNPEFLKEGAALDDFLKPDRVVIGVDSERARALMAELYAPFVRTENPVLFMDTRSAELTKYAANAMLATRISFMNDVAALCERVGADVDLVRKGMGADRRIGYPFLFPGVGYGGSCFPKDVKALYTTAREHGLELELLRAVEATNARQKRLLVDKARAHFGSLRGRHFAAWGLSFKPKTDDMREAPSVQVIRGLLDAGATVCAHDPVAMDAARRVFGDSIRYAEGPYEALPGADALLVITEWNEFRHPDFERVKSLLRTPVILDGRNLYDPRALAARGFTYHGVGRPAAGAPRA